MKALPTPFTYTAVINGIDTYAKAYNKENAVRFLQQYDASLTSDDVKKSKQQALYGGLTPVDAF